MPNYSDIWMCEMYGDVDEPHYTHEDELRLVKIADMREKKLCDIYLYHNGKKEIVKKDVGLKDIRPHLEAYVERPLSDDELQGFLDYNIMLYTPSGVDVSIDEDAPYERLNQMEKEIEDSYLRKPDDHCYKLCRDY